MQDKGFLLLRVQTLRQGLSDWRTKLNDQFRDDQEEKGSLNTALKTEVSQLRSEVNQLKDTRTLRQQVELTVSLASGERRLMLPHLSHRNSCSIISCMCCC
ncbi:TPA: hypothetical protein ACH3X2_008377 [Trebouxia sp. C0005]